MEDAIELRHVSKRYRERLAGHHRGFRSLLKRRAVTDTWALQDVTMSVKPGETVGIVGANGSGKSTLLRLIAGISRPTSGTVIVRHPVSSVLSLGEDLHPLLSGEENAISVAVLAGLTRSEALRRLPAIAAFAELEQDMDRPLRTFSNGMRLRLAFSVAAHLDTSILLLDEVLAVGDLSFQSKCLSYLDRLQEREATVLLTSHYIAQVRQVCRRTAWFSEGRLQMCGDTDEVANRYEEAVREGLPLETLPRGGFRLGTKEVEMTDVAFLDESDSRIGRLHAGTGGIARVKFIAHQDVLGSIFSVTIHSVETGARCLEVDTTSDGLVVDVVAGPGTVELALERLDLADGCYHLDVGIYGRGWESIYDYWWKAYQFEVLGGGGKAIMAPPRRWKTR